jgi:hypothetical protein
MTIDEYLAELARCLPRSRRGRFLEEAGEHLRDAARANRLRGLDADAAERAAVESFGEPAVVARSFAAVTAVSAVRRGSLLALGAVIALVLPLYGIPENTLPPARWEAKPAEIALLQGVSLALWSAAIALAAVGLGLSFTRYARLTAPVLVIACGAVAGFVVVGVALFVVWLDAAPWTPLWPFLGLALPIAICCLAACVGAALWVQDHSRTLGRLVQD